MRLYCLVLVSFFTLALNTGCKTATGIKENLTQEDLHNVRNLLVDVTVNESFEVYHSRDNATVTGAAIGGLLGAAIEADVRFKEDKEIFEPIAMELIDFRLRHVIEHQLDQKLKSAQLFPEVSMAPMDKDYELLSGQAALKVEVERWGYRRSAINDDEVSPFIEAVVVLQRGDSGKNDWEYILQLRGDEGHSPESLPDKLDLVRSEMRGLINQLTNRIVNELKYAPAQ